MSQVTPDDEADKLITDAEAGRGKIFGATGKLQFNTDYARNMIHSVLVDEEYTSVGAHLDEQMISKIRKGEYVDFSKLLPRDKIVVEEDHRLQPIFRDGQVFWQTPNDAPGIYNFNKWEQAFRVYSRVYSNYHPYRVSELIQYANDIHTASLTFTWENVYTYDKEFRLHIAKHPMRSWSVILQHAWNLRMKDRIGNQSSGGHFDAQHNKEGRHNGAGLSQSRQKETCKHYNKGRCSFGNTCKYEHRCAYCFKLGHGALVCRKLNADKDNKSTRKDFKDNKEQLDKNDK